MSRRRLYIPITRSGSSILASLFTQYLDRTFKHKQPRPMLPLHMVIYLISVMCLFSLFTDQIASPYDVWMAWFVVITGVVMLIEMKIRG